MLDITEHIACFLNRQQAEQIHFLQALVQTPSDNPPGDCAAFAQRVQSLLEAQGLTVACYPVPADRVRAVGMVSATNLLVRCQFGGGHGGGVTIALNAHGDVVPPGEGWQHAPYGGEIGHDPVYGAVMFGRGVAVSKSDIATYAWVLLALQAVQRQGARLQGTVELHITCDEESGGEIGPAWLLEQGISRPDYAICAGFAHGITVAHNGCLHVEVTVYGRQAHAAMPETGIDAIEGSSRILQALYAYRRELAERVSKVAGIRCATLNIGLIAGGINTNVVPDLVRFRIDRRMIPEEAGRDAEGEIRQVIEAAAQVCSGIRVEVKRVMLAEPLIPLPGADKLITLLQHHAERLLAEPVPVHGVPLYTDARHYAKHGIPVVLYGAGPRTLLEARGHNSDENLRLCDLRLATEVVTRAVAGLLQMDDTAA